MCSQTVIFDRNHISASVLEQIARYRYQIFVEKIGWNLPADHERKLELDSFDKSENVHYLIVYQESNIVGTARLTPANQPNVSRDIFRYLFDSKKYFLSSWEISRMAVTPNNSKYNRSIIALNMLVIIQGFAAERGATSLIGVTLSQVIRKWHESGLNILDSGREIMCDGVLTTGFHLSVEPVIAQDQNPAFRVLRNEAA